MQQYRPMTSHLLRPAVALAVVALLIGIVLPLMLAAEGAAS
jgi:hypothetical protein